MKPVPDDPDDRVSIAEVLNMLPDAPSATTRSRGWAGITLDVHDRVDDYSVSTPGHDHHLICYCRAGSARLIQGREGLVHSSVISAGMSLIMPAGFASSWEGDATASARMRVPTSLILSAAEQIAVHGTSRVEIRNVFETRDVLVERIALSLIAEIGRAPHPAQAMIADTMSCALAAHLIRSYNAFDMPVTDRSPTLGPIELARLTEYIEENVQRPIGLAELAGIVNVSRFHFARLFKHATGTTAIRFVEQCRIRRAQALIEQTDAALAHVALMTGFSDQSHFTRRFRRWVGCTPGTFAREQGRRRAGRRADKADSGTCNSC